jgi:hypothetical protein
MKYEIKLPAKVDYDAFLIPFSDNESRDKALDIFLSLANDYDVTIDYTESMSNVESFVASCTCDARNGKVIANIKTPLIDCSTAFLIAMHEMAHVVQANEAYERVFEFNDIDMYVKGFIGKINSFEQEVDACVKSIQYGKEAEVNTSVYEAKAKEYCLHYLVKEVEDGAKDMPDSYTIYNIKYDAYPKGILAEWYGITQDTWENALGFTWSDLDMDLLHKILKTGKK